MMLSEVNNLQSQKRQIFILEVFMEKLISKGTYNTKHLYVMELHNLMYASNFVLYKIHRCSQETDGHNLYGNMYV
jgi:hypothetical protein